MSTGAASACAEHPGAVAGWSCADCQRALCPDCVASEVAGAGLTTFECCVHCDGRAELRYVPGGRESYAQLLLQSLRLPVGLPTVLSGLAVWILVEMAFRFSEGASALSFAALVCVLWGLFFGVLQAGARGADLIGRGGTVNVLHEVVLPAARLSVITITVAVLLLMTDIRGGAVHGVYADPSAWAVALPLGAWAPALLIALARGEPLWRAISPFGAGSMVRALGVDYVVLSGVTLAVAALVLFWIGAGETGATAGIRLLPQLLHIFALYAVLFVARFVGLVMAARAVALGLPLRPDQRVPALPGVSPRGLRRPRTPVLPERPRPEFVELDTAPPEGPLTLEGFADVDPLDHALATFAIQPDTEARQLETRALVEIGQRAAARGRLDQAVRALKLAAQLRPADPEAPRACVILARLYAERLEEPASAERLYRYVVERYPETAAARFATAQLGQ